MNHSSFYTFKTSISMIQLLFLVLCCLNSFSYAALNSFHACLSTRETLESKIYTPKNQSYTFVLEDYMRNGRFNTSTTRKPTAIFTPFDESQVEEFVKCAKKTGLHLRIRSGGHDFEGLSYTSIDTPFAILDMSNLRSIEIDVEKATAWVGSGATLGELYYRIWEKSKVLAFPAGVCPTIGVGGHLSGGGYGNLMRKYGISVDNVVDAKIVDANGRILDRKAMGEDLFWAIKGGGGASFGVVLSYKINLVPVPRVVTVFDVTNVPNITEILHRWQYVAYKFDKELYVRVSLASDGQTGSTRVSFLALYLGTADKLVAHLTAQFPELGVGRQDCQEMSWIRAVVLWAGFPAKTPETALLSRNLSTSNYKVKSDYVTAPIPVDGLDGLLRRMQAPGSDFYVKFNPYGGRMSEILGSATPFPHRAGNMFKIQYVVVWNGTGNEVEANSLKKMRDLYDYMRPFVSKNPRRAYLNYRDIDIGRSNISSRKYFGDNLDRLVRVKTKVDPTNFFWNEQSIRPLLK